MTFEYVIIPSQNCIAQKFTGTVTLKDVMACAEKMWADPDYRREYGVLSDLRDAATSGDVRDVGALFQFLQRSETSRGLWAAIFSQPRATALAFLFQATLPLASQLGIFSTWEAACDYLEVDIAASLFPPAPPLDGVNAT